MTVSLAEWTLVMFSSALCFVILRFVHHVRMFFPSSFAPLAFFLWVQFPEWSVQPLVAVPGGEPSSVFSHIAVQFQAD